MAGTLGNSRGTDRSFGVRSGCICCCFNPSSSGFTHLQPDGCACKRSVARDGVFLAIVLAALCAAPTVLASCYFGGHCPLSPYRPAARLPSAGGVELSALPTVPTAAVLRRRAR
jgi:hypothetical protein